MESIYQQIGQRTGGNIYLSVVGPVRTGKSTFIKRFMEQLVLPNITDVYQRERARDELPQSGSGKTIMTAEPKFVPEEAVEICPDEVTKLSVRLIDSVGYMVEGAMGATEDGVPRMVTTPWADQEIPMTEAAELGTKKVMEDHCTAGILITTDGTVTEIPREDYLDAEARSIQDMKATGKPFLVLLNTTDPSSEAAQNLSREIAQTYQVRCQCVNCLTLNQAQIQSILCGLLYEFPVREMRFFLPRWVDALQTTHAIKQALYEAMRRSAEHIAHISEAEPAIRSICELESVQDYSIREIDLGTGTVSCILRFPEELFYTVLSEQSGLSVENDGDLMRLLEELSSVKKEYDKISGALESVRATGYGIVMPTPEEMHLEVPEIVHKGSSYGVKLRASAPSIHMMRADIEAEISPMVGDEKQSEDLVKYLLGEYEGDTEKLWQSNIFGKSVYELVSEGLNTKLKRMPDDARMKLKQTLSRIINEGSGGLICIIL